MKRSSLLALSACIFCGTFPGAANAQKLNNILTALKPAQTGIAVGPTFPLGHLRVSSGTGAGILGFVEYLPGRLPFRLRIDGTYDALRGRNGQPSPKFSSLTANAVRNLPKIDRDYWRVPTAGLRTYVIGGTGFYGNSYLPGLFGVRDEQRHFGLNFGVGMNFTAYGDNLFVEARYNRIWGNGNSAAFLPVRIGVTF